MKYLLVTYQWRILTRPQVAAFDCPVTFKVTFSTVEPCNATIKIVKY